MKQLYAILVFTIFLIGHNLFAQITITSSDYANYYSEGNNYTTYFDQTTTSIDIGQPGGGNSWDFSSLHADVEGSAVMAAIGSTPYADKFPDANYATYNGENIGDSSGTYSYWRLGNNFEFCGAFSSDELIPGTNMLTETHNTPFEISVQLPLTAGSNWTQTYQATITSTMAPPLPPLNETDDVTITHTVDAWGTMVIPGISTPLNALRIRQDESRVMHTEGGDSYIRWISYQFISKNFMTAGFTLADTTSPDNGVVNIVGGGWSISSLTDVKSETTIPKTFRLEQNYPNPFNPTTIINFTIPENGFSSLVVFNSLGQEVSRLVNGKLAKGHYSIKFNADRLPSGIYFYKLTEGGFSAVKKCILLK